jgi:hypothetical protein
MATRIRLVLGALVALTLLVAPVVVQADGDGLGPARGDAVAATIDGGGSGGTSAVHHRATRPALPPLVVLAGTALVAALAAPPVRARREQRRRRLDDAGDAWRSLLLGAPPARA